MGMSVVRLTSWYFNNEIYVKWSEVKCFEDVSTWNFWNFIFDEIVSVHLKFQYQNLPTQIELFFSFLF